MKRNSKKPIYFKEYKPYFYACISVMIFFLSIILFELILIIIYIQTSINNVTINGAYERLMERYPIMLFFIVISFIGIFMIGRKDLEIYEDKIALPIKIYKIKEKKYIKYNDISRIYIKKPKKYLKWFDPWLMFNFLDNGGKTEEKKGSREGELIFLDTKDGKSYFFSYAFDPDISQIFQTFMKNCRNKNTNFNIDRELINRFEK